ncbi:hypothetical protein RSAG8_13172, partial [Rhizoctonia solani AG-8 WAC10335]
MPRKGSETGVLPKYVTRREDGQVKCLACDSSWIQRTSLAKHLKSPGHAEALPLYESRVTAAVAESIRQTNTLSLSSLPAPNPNSDHTQKPALHWASDDLQHLDNNGIDTNDYSGVDFSFGTVKGGVQQLDWSQLGLSFSNGILETEMEPEMEEDEYAMPLPQRILEDLNEEDPDIELLQERFAELKAKGSFSPYKNKTIFLLDMLDNIPRHRLSTAHLKLIMWVMEEAGCHNMPTFYELRQTQKHLKALCGIEAHHYKSSRENSFDMLDIPQLVGRDVSNPIVAPHLVFYPEDSGDTLAESWQAKKWKEAIPLEQLTPMYSNGGKSYYVNELARLHDGSYVIPQKWITRNGVLTADCWPVSWRSVPGDELNSGLHVSNNIVHIPSTAFASNYFDIMEFMEPTNYRFTDDSKSFQAKMPNALRNLTSGSEDLLSCFIKPWCDDVSGGRTKQYQPHNNIYLSHANLPGHLLNQEYVHLLNQEYFVRFVSTTTHASSVEQFEAVKQQLDANNKNPIRAYNAVTGRYVRLRIFILNLPADNCAQSEVASHVAGGNKLCRKCNAGGPYQFVETEEGYKELFQPGKARTPAETVQVIWDQISTACHGKARTPAETVQVIWDQISTACLGIEDRVTEMFTNSGVKDPTAQDLIIKLIERGRELRKQLKKPKEEIDDSQLIKLQTNNIVHIPSTAFASNYFDIMEFMEPTNYRFTDDSKSFQAKMPNALCNLTSGSEDLLSCFIKPWCDDVSGGRTKQYQPHNNIYLSHANLPGHLLNQEYFVRFVSTTTHASSVEQFEAVKQQLDANNKNPIRAYNAVTGRYVRLRIFILNLPADNRAQSEVASHVAGGNKLCRKCNAGGPYQFVETEEGYKELFQPGKARTPAETVQVIWDQISTACLGIEDRVTEMFTNSGVKDPTAQDLIIKLIERGCELRKQLKKPKEEIDDSQLIKLQTNSNMLGLDPHRDTPVEILHTILLGVEKYAWYMFHSSTGPDALKKFETRLQSSSILGLEVDPIRASYIVNYRNGLIGRQLKMLMQLTAFHVHDLVPPALFSVIKAVGELGAMLWYSKIDHLEEYLADLSVLVNNVLDAFARFDPRRIITKMKLHMLVHLVADIRNHGPAVRFSTEVFECYNGVFRMCSVLSNHQAPSQDIARKMIDLERFRHIASGGFWETETGVECASQDVRRYFETNLQLQTHLGWVRPETMDPGKIRLQNKKQERKFHWKDTVGGKAGVNNPFWEARLWYEGKSSMTKSGDKFEVGSWAVAKQNEASILLSNYHCNLIYLKPPVIGRVEQILMDSESGHGIVILSVFDLAENRHPVLSMPVLVQTQPDICYTTVVSSYDVEFTINVQHDCISLSCPLSGVEDIRQERLNTTIQRQTVEHRDGAVFIINMHALHNAQRIRHVLPQSLTKPIPLHAPQDRVVFLSKLSEQLHSQQTTRREELSKKRRVAREAREKSDLAAEPRE